MEVKTGYTLIKHYYSQEFEELAHSKVTFEVGEDANLTQMLDAFQYFLKASGFSFDGYLDFVKDDEVDPFVEDMINRHKEEKPNPLDAVPHPPRWAAKSDLMSTFDEKM